MNANVCGVGCRRRANSEVPQGGLSVVLLFNRERTKLNRSIHLNSPPTQPFIPLLLLLLLLTTTTSTRGGGSLQLNNVPGLS